MSEWTSLLRGAPAVAPLLITENADSCRGSCQLPLQLQQTQLGVLGNGLRKANANTNEAHRFPSATEGFFQ